MKERPILFQGAMVRALLAGTKTQTRRAWRNSPPPGVPVGWVPGETKQPYGWPGDRLWVRETYFAFGRWETRFSEKKGRDEWHFVDMTLETGHAYSYAADGGEPALLARRRSAGVTPAWCKRPAIFMPRAASRILLEITGVRVERLHAISEADALAEGYPGYVDARVSGRHWYELLWGAINGAGSWDANPWVWVVEFKKT